MRLTVSTGQFTSSKRIIFDLQYWRSDKGQWKLTCSFKYWCRIIIRLRVNKNYTCMIQLIVIIEKYTIQEYKWVKWGIPRRVDMFCLILSLSLFASFFLSFFFIRDNAFVRFLCRSLSLPSLVNSMALLYMSVRLIKKSIAVLPKIIERINRGHSLKLSIGNWKIWILPADNIWTWIWLVSINLVVDTYLANIIFDVIRILSGLTSHIFSHDDWLSS